VEGCGCASGFVGRIDVCGGVGWGYLLDTGAEMVVGIGGGGGDGLLYII
jgi:hypothetical protein